MDYIEARAAYFAPFIQPDTVAPYVERIRKDKAYGGFAEIVAVALMYQRPVSVWVDLCGPHQLTIPAKVEIASYIFATGAFSHIW